MHIAFLHTIIVLIQTQRLSVEFGKLFFLFDFINFVENKIQTLLDNTFERIPYNILNRLIVYLILAFFLSLVILIPVTIVVKLYIGFRDNKYARLNKKYSNYIIHYLINDLEPQKMEELESLTSTFKRRVLIDVLMSIDKAENPEMSGRIRKLYLNLKLDKDSGAKLHSYFWHKKIVGIRELSHMRVKKETSYIMELLQSPKEVVRIEAQMGLIKLLPFVPFAFLDSQEKPFTVWEQINVFDLIRKKRIEIPEFHLWLDNWNDSVVMFCLDMIRVLKQKEAAPKLVELLNHDNEFVKGKAIKTLIDLEDKEAVAKLKEIYILEELPNQLNIIRSIGKLRLEGELNFLEENLKDEEFKIRMECCKAIALLGEVGINRLKTISQEADEELKAIISHILDEKI